jgi:multidrug efflux pump subunit AcrA (membrane-fusion protein)
MEQKLRNQFTSIIILLCLSITISHCKSSKKGERTYTQVKAIQSNLLITVRSSGVVSPMNRLEIKPPVGGRIEKVLIAEGDFVKKGNILAWMSSTERAALLDAARARGDNAMKEWEDVYKPTPVMAPLHGMVIANNIKPGQTVTQQDVLVVLSDALIVKAKVDETDISTISKKQKAMITIDSFPGQKIISHVRHIAYEAVTENSVTMYEVEIEPDNRPEFLRSGMSATIDFVVIEKDEVTLVPENAVYKNDEGQDYVLFFTGEGNKPRKVPIKVGLTHDAKTEVLEGVLPDDILLLVSQDTKKKKEKTSDNPFNPLPIKGKRR